MTAKALHAVLSAKKHVTVLVTDSGLGGMAVFARIAARFKSDPIFPEVSLIYFNAWPEQDRGYNSFEDLDERVRIFDRALEGMRRFEPDIILIACNTLSVIYDRTRFSRRAALPVIDIVNFGVEMVYERLCRNGDATALILGTVTTVASDVHRSRLLQKGVAPDRIRSQPCDQLATQIEMGPGSAAVAGLVDRFMEEAAQKLVDVQGPVLAALFCTHFGYCGELIREKLQSRVRQRVAVLDPNQRMAAYLFETAGGGRNGRTVVNMRVVSRIVWHQAKIDAISAMVAHHSVEAARALINYEHIPELFTF